MEMEARQNGSNLVNGWKLLYLSPQSMCKKVLFCVMHECETDKIKKKQKKNLYLNLNEIKSIGHLYDKNVVLIFH